MAEKNWVEELVKIMKILRSENGCPWDREQTHKSIAHNLLEEAYETYEAIVSSNDTELKEELGDLLLQIVFHAEIASEEKRFDIQDVAKGIVEKLIKRHPHVFGDADVRTSEEVLHRWEKIKKEEKSGFHTFDSVPKSMPSLLYALNIQKKASRLGFDWDDAGLVLDKIIEEVGELKEAYEKLKSSRNTSIISEIEEEVGDVLFATINFSRLAGIDPEFSLRKVTEKFIERVKYVEELAKEEGIDLTKAEVEILDELWNRAKTRINEERGDS
jgi:tetrapyrrole methylase family protein/MazG family protein